MPSTAAVVSPWTAAIWARISSVALAVCVASVFTSLATTAKPRPDSPARAASMVAFSASRLVWLAIWLISDTTSPIFCAAAARLCTRLFDCWPSFAALPTTLEACVSRRPISSIDDDNSSAAAATVWTLSEACADAVETVSVCCRDCSTMADIDCAVACISVAAADTRSTTPRTLASKLSASAAKARRFSCSDWALASA